MAQIIGSLESFEQEIMRKAAEERDAVIKAAEEERKAALDKEENRLLEELYQKIQGEIAEIKTNNVKDISRENLELKKQLYRQREQYLSEIIARARVELTAFAKGKDYPAYLIGKAESFAKEYRFPGSVIRLRTEDMPYADRIRQIYGDCTITADDSSITIGGAILLNTERGVEVDYSLDAALQEQREWFYSNSNFNFDEQRGEAE